MCRDWDTFRRIFEPLVCRNTKRYVKDEMALPPQTRALLSVDFTAVEEINYQHIFEQMLDDCGKTLTFQRANIYSADFKFDCVKRVLTLVLGAGAAGSKK